jgi:hypothetical protein
MHRKDSNIILARNLVIPQHSLSIVSPCCMRVFDTSNSVDTDEQRETLIAVRAVAIKVVVRSEDW